MIKEKLDSLSGMNYPEVYKNALMLLRKAARNNEIACTAKEVVANRVGFWTFLKPIKLALPNVINTDIGLTVEYDNFFSDSLGVYISDCCFGDIDVAIKRVDMITRAVSSEVTHTGKYNLLYELQQVAGFLRDIAIVITKYKKRPDRDINQGTLSQAHFSFRVACMLCAQPIASREHTRCIQHLKPKSYEELEPTEEKSRRSAIRRMQRIINNSYINLKLFDKYIPDVKGVSVEGGEAKKELMKKLAVLIKEHGKTMEAAFDERCELLEGWARRQSIQQSFRAEIKLIEEFLEIKIATDTLTLADLELYFGSIINIVRSFEHTRTLVTEEKNSSFYFDLSLTSIENAARIVQACVKIDCNISKKELQLVTYTLIREGQFCLMRKASKDCHLPVVNKWHKEYLATSLKFDY